MSARVRGMVDWGLTRDDQGKREYTAKWLVECTSVRDGPGIVSLAQGLPATGSIWQFGNEADPWVFCRPEFTIAKAFVPNEPGYHWTVEQKFSNKEYLGQPRCNEQQIKNPLLEPPRISGSYVKATKVALGKAYNSVVLIDADGVENELEDSKIYSPIRTTSFEQIRGKSVEFDDSRPTVTIEVSIATLPLQMYTSMVDCLNDAELWGLPKRTIKLSNVQWKRQLYGTCTFYYVVSYEFEINFKTWDRLIASEGRKCLRGWSAHERIKNPTPPPEFIQPAYALDPNAVDTSWPNPAGNPNYWNPKNYDAFKDVNGENSTCFHDIYGRPVEDFEDIAYIKVYHYDEANFLLLGVPATL